MPRQSRIDAPGARHHVIVRGIERRKRRVLIGAEAWAVMVLERLAPVQKIFRDDQDRYNFL